MEFLCICRIGSPHAVHCRAFSRIDLCTHIICIDSNNSDRDARNILSLALSTQKTSVVETVGFEPLTIQSAAGKRRHRRRDAVILWNNAGQDEWVEAEPAEVHACTDIFSSMQTSTSTGSIKYGQCFIEPQHAHATI